MALDPVELNGPSTEGPKYVLKVLEGANIGKQYELGPKPLTLGRHASNTIQIVDDAASNYHAEVNREPIGFVLTDLGSTNGTRVKLKNKGTLEEVIESMRSFPSLDLYSAPQHFMEVTDEPARPQTRLDRDNGNGMTITVGRVFPDNVFDYRFVALSHNTVRGAAGCAVLNAELLIQKGII